MKKNEPIKSIMTKEIKTIHLSTKLSEVRELFEQCSFHHLPVTDGERLIGLLSYSDFLRIDSRDLYNQNDKQADIMLDSLTSVKEVMTDNLVTIKPEDTIRQATQILSKGSFHSLPVIDQKKHLVGMVTSTDLLRFFFEQY